MAKKAQPINKSKVPNSLYAHFEPLSLKTVNHKCFYESLCHGQDTVTYGVAGSGKTYITLHFALSQLQQQFIQKIIIVRSAVPTRDIGFLKGNEDEKMQSYEVPYIKTVNDLLGRGDAYELLKKRGEIEFLSSSYLRGLTFDNAFIIVDEVQNMTFHEIDTIYTRVGFNTQLAFVGDIRQADEGVGKAGTGFNSLLKLVGNIGQFDVHEFDFDDIVRSEKVKNWIVQKTLLGL